jgi:hypothetical protein
MIRNEKELRELKEELSKLTGFIADFGTDKEFQSSEMTFANDVVDALSWVLNEISTENFRSEAYLSITALKEVANGIERRTGKKLENYE